jgi:hypothetical protein
MSTVTPIRADIKIPKKKRRDREASIKNRLHDLQFRVGRAAALARSMALALDGKVLEFDIEAAEGCLGVAELLDQIRTEMYEMSQEGRP